MKLVKQNCRAHCGVGKTSQEQRQRGDYNISLHCKVSCEARRDPHSSGNKKHGSKEIVN